MATSSALPLCRLGARDRRLCRKVYLANPDRQASCIELGYFLSQANTGQGFVTEVAHGVICFAFEHLHVARIELQCTAENQASMKAAERCGFQLEDRLRRRHHKKDGTSVDRLWYGLLRAEWQAATVDPV
ncbi:MAG: GNAT family protein [Caldilineaceae bacterium]